MRLNVNNTSNDKIESLAHQVEDYIPEHMERKGSCDVFLISTIFYDISVLSLTCLVIIGGGFVPM